MEPASQVKSSRIAFLSAAVVFCGTLLNLLLPGFRFSFQSALKPIEECALSYSQCSISYWWASIALIVLAALAIIAAVLLTIYKNRLFAQMLITVLVLQLIVGLSSMLRSEYFWHNPFVMILALRRPDYLLLLVEIGAAVYAATKLGGRSFSSPLPIGKRGVSIITIAFVVSILAGRAVWPALWGHYQDKVVAIHTQNAAGTVASAFKNLPIEHINPETIARKAGISFVYIGDMTKYQLCDDFHYDASGGRPLSDFLHHKKGRQCITYSVPDGTLYKNDIRIDKNMLVVGRKPSYQISAVSLDGPTDTIASKINVGNVKFYTQDGKSGYSEAADIGRVLTYYWRQNNLENKEEVYKIVVQNDKQDPRYCRLIDPSAVSAYCPETTTNLTLVAVDMVGTQGAIRAKKPNGQEVAAIFEIGYFQPKAKDKQGNEIPLSSLKPGTHVNLIYESNTTFTNEDFVEVRAL
jgi:hypothetical protein